MIGLWFRFWCKLQCAKRQTSRPLPPSTTNARSQQSYVYTVPNGFKWIRYEHRIRQTLGLHAAVLEPVRNAGSKRIQNWTSWFAGAVLDPADRTGSKRFHVNRSRSGLVRELCEQALFWSLARTSDGAAMGSLRETPKERIGSERFHSLNFYFSPEKRERDSLRVDKSSNSRCRLVVYWKCSRQLFRSLSKSLNLLEVLFALAKRSFRTRFSCKTVGVRVLSLLSKKIVANHKPNLFSWCEWSTRNVPRFTTHVQSLQFKAFLKVMLHGTIRDDDF